MAEQNEKLMETQKKRKTVTDPKRKKGLIAGIVLAVFVILIGVGSLIIHNQGSYSIYNKLVVAMAPDKIEDYGKTFYLKVNPKYDQKTAPSEPMFICYYLDENGKEVDLPGGAYTENGENGQVLIAFLGKAVEKVTAIQKTAKIVFGILIAILICVLIYIWYRWDTRNEERQKLAAHGGKEMDKKKNKH